MRLVRVAMADEQLEPVCDRLEAEGIDYARQRTWIDGTEGWLLECPIPTDAVGPVLTHLEDAGVDTERFTTISSLESAQTPQAETLQRRYASDFDPLTRAELRTKARDLSHDTRSFLALLLVSALIAVAGLLVGSPAVVVGSMVIAPIVGPVLTAAVGTVTGDRRMLLDSLWIQAGGVMVAILGAAAMSVGLQLAGFYPTTLDISAIDLIMVRIAPNLVTMVVGGAAGTAAALGLATKGPTSLIGVMIAAALVPAAATVGIAAAWGEYRIALGSTLLLVLTLVVINLGAVATLRLFYAPDVTDWLRQPTSRSAQIATVGTLLALVVLTGVVGAAGYQQITFERDVTGETQAVFDEVDVNLEIVTVQSQVGLGPPPSEITVTASRTADGTDPPQVAGVLEQRIAEATGRDVHVRVRFRTYQRAT